MLSEYARTCVAKAGGRLQNMTRHLCGNAVFNVYLRGFPKTGVVEAIDERDFGAGPYRYADEAGKCGPALVVKAYASVTPTCAMRVPDFIGGLLLRDVAQVFFGSLSRR
jgi:hypothetical protein